MLWPHFSLYQQALRTCLQLSSERDINALTDVTAPWSRIHHPKIHSLGNRSHRTPCLGTLTSNCLLQSSCRRQNRGTVLFWMLSQTFKNGKGVLRPNLSWKIFIVPRCWGRERHFLQRTHAPQINPSPTFLWATLTKLIESWRRWSARQEKVMGLNMIKIHFLR